MMITPETPITSLPRVTARILPAFKRLGIFTVRDLLLHLPSRYEDFSNEKDIRDLAAGEVAAIEGVIRRIANIRTWKQRMAITEAVIGDSAGTLRAIWFNQPFLVRNLRQEDRVRLSGKIVLGKRGLYLQNPAYEKISARSEGIHTRGLVAVYPEARGITSRWLRSLIRPVLDLAGKLADPLPEDMRKRNALPHLADAVHALHAPTTKEEAARARRRFDFETLLVIQLNALRTKMQFRARAARAIPIDLALIKQFVATLPYALTDAQRRSLWEILQDTGKSRPMNRLLEGDVGSGKTVVAAGAALAAVHAGLRVALMAPTEILAHQHYETLQKTLAPFAVSIGLLTGSIKKIRAQSQIIIGTHALIQKNTQFKNLGLVIVDEQHRFGVEQRAILLRNANDANSCEFSENETIQGQIIEKELSYRLNGVFFHTQKKLGRFARERQYADMVEQQLEATGITYRRENPFVVAGRKSNFADFIVENRVLIELKAKPYVTKDDYAQTMRYLQSGNLRLGLLVNFRQEYLKPKRILNPQLASFASVSHHSHRYTPHFLSMTATPIPRTLALTIYGDLDLSVLDEMPRNRRKIITRIVEPAAREKTYAFLRSEIEKGRQIFVICPRIDISETDADTPLTPRKLIQQDMKTVKQEYEKLSKEIFPDLRVAMLHGKMKSKEKEDVMKKFKRHAYDILVSTSVVEVGVDISNASVIMIEGAERFGLATLHQFRGRVGRGAEQSYCFLFTSDGSIAGARLRAMTEAHTGFELAEKDLALRGAGDPFGTKQWGLSPGAMQALADPVLVRAVRIEAVRILNKDPGLAGFPILQKQIDALQKKLHPE